MLADIRYLGGCLPATEHTCAHTHKPTVLMARFVDNVYLGVTGMNENLQALPSVLLFAQVLLDVVYDVQLKWEKSGTEVDWCEAGLVTQPAVALLMKGVAFQHPSSQNPVPDLMLWERWVDCSSPNA